MSAISLDSLPLFDAHFHIIDQRYPLIENNGYLPEPFTCSDYRARMQRYRLAGGAVVSGSFQGFDQTYLVDALRELGRGFVGVTQLPADTSDAELLRLHESGVRAVRFNLKRGGSESIEHLARMAHRVHDIVGWHVELYVDSRELEPLHDTLIALPRVSIDHLGLSHGGFSTILKLAEAGVRIKATGFGRIDFELTAALRALHAANPHALMFGTDLPSTRAPRAYEDDDYVRVIEALGEEGARRVLFENALDFYRVERA
jgi:predicted TIM-barrel fold metal-dependent hydrolase